MQHAATARKNRQRLNDQSLAFIISYVHKEKQFHLHY